MRIAIAILLASAGVAHAGGKPKAHLACNLDGGAPIKKGAKIGLDTDVWCQITWDDRATPPEDATATIALTEQRADGPHVATAPSTHFMNDEGLAYWQTDAAFVHGTDFASCGGITVTGKLALGGQDLWTGTTTIGVKCAKAKKLAASLRCSMSFEDGTQIAWPGKGDREKPRMEHELDCALDSKTEPTDGTRATWTISHDDGSKSEPKVTDFRQYPGDKVLYGFEQAFDESDYAACSNFTLSVIAVDKNGQTVWTGTHKFKQTCPD